MDSVKQEKRYFPDLGEANNGTFNVSPIDISSSSCSSSSSSSDDSDSENSFFVNIRSELNKKRSLNEFDNGYLSSKKPKLESCDFNIALSPNSLSFLPPPFPLSFVAPKDVTETEPALEGIPAAMDANVNINTQATPVFRTCKQFWKAGDYEGGNADESSSKSVGMAHVRVHPKFLHSNATSHKWALGAFAELLDNSLDEVCYGATYVNVDMIKNKKDGANMLLVEDNGGGMTPDKMRQCMSLGYSAKSKMANTIGQYGNGFKTSTMRLGADVIVFSRCQGNNGNSPTQSIGMLSYSFLMGTGKQDIIVPMIDYEERGESWNKMLRSSLDDWNRNLETIIQWSPYTSEEDLIQQFNFLEDQGTRIIIYNLWEDDEGNLELDFDSDSHDIQIRGVNRDEKNIEMARKYPNSRHFLTYRHSLRSYASILYLRLPSSFKIILRGKDVQHHNIVNDMMLTKEITYKPLHLPEKLPKDLNMVATVTIGFVKDARHHIDIQGFNVYHKNRLIKPFWRVWNAAGSDGRGAIGVLEANFVEPAHDKQGFERTPVLSRLEARLVAIQKKYWCTNCQEVGYAARRPYSKINIRVSAKTDAIASDTGTSSSPSHPGSAMTGSRTSDKEKSTSRLKQNDRDCTRSKTKLVMDCCQKSPGVDGASEDGSNHTAAPASGQSQPDSLVQGTNLEIPRKPRSKAAAINGVGQDLSNGDTEILIRKEANQESGERFKRKERPTIDVVQRDLQQEKDKCKFLENELKETQKQLQKAQEKIEEMDLEQIALIDMIQEERMRRDEEEQRLRNKLRVALDEIDEQLEKLKQLEKTGNNSKLNIEE